MYRLAVVCVSYAIAVVFVCGSHSEGPDAFNLHSHHRQTRYLSFLNSSHFFVRLNFKANMVPWNQIFAQAIGFRFNWEEPPTTFRPYKQLHRRSLYSHLETVLDKHGFNGHHCIRRAICELNSFQNDNSLYRKIMEIVFRKTNATSEWHDARASHSCLHSRTTCPFSLFDISLYTDV